MGADVPFYFDIGNTVTTNGTANTESDHLRLLTIGNQLPAKVVGLMVALHQGTAVGAARVRLKTYGTASTAGSAFTPNERNPKGPAAETTAFTAPTVGSTPATRIIVGGSVLGGTGGWAALDLDHALSLSPNGGAGGNVDLHSICQIVSASMDYVLEFCE